jgi:hypothetical protein
LRKQVHRIFPAAAGDVADSLCRENMAAVIDDVLRPAVEESLRSLNAASDAYGDAWNAAKNLLGCLLPFAVDPAWIAERESQGKLSDIEFEVMVETLGGIELVSARFRQMEPKLKAEQGKADVYSDEAIACPPLPITGYDENYQLQELLREIWQRVFPRESREVLSPKDIEKLNVALARIEKHKEAHYYIPVMPDAVSPLRRREFYEKLLRQLPSMTVIYLNSSAGTSPLRVQNEIDFMDAIRSFLLLPDTLSKKRH